MMARTHHLIGASSAFVATTALNAPAPVVAAAVIGATAASSMPDVDQRIGISHRKITHRPSLQLAFFAVWGLLAASVVPELSPWIAVMAASLAFGCVMHSCADAMTVDRQGIQLLWPISRRGYHLLPRSMRVWVGTKSTSERVFGLVWTGFVLIYVYARFRHLIST